MVPHGLAQLSDTAHPKFGIGRPLGGVERTSGRIDGAVHIAAVGVGRRAEHLLGGGSTVGKLPADPAPTPPMNRSLLRSAAIAIRAPA